MIDQRSRGGPVEILSVDWADPRASVLRAAMDVEMTAAYGSGLDRLIPEVRRELRAAFSVEPRTVVATLLAVDGELAVGHAGLRRLPVTASRLRSVCIRASATA